MSDFKASDNKWMYGDIEEPLAPMDMGSVMGIIVIIIGLLVWWAKC